MPNSKEPSTITFKMDKPNMEVLLATADLGALAFSYGDRVFPDKGDAGINFSLSVDQVAERVVESFEENDQKVYLTNADYIILLIAIRGAFEAFMSLSKGGIQRMLTMSGDSFVEINYERVDRKKMAHTAHILLDFLECHASQEVLSMWIEERRNASITMLDKVTDSYEKNDQK